MATTARLPRAITAATGLAALALLFPAPKRKRAGRWLMKKWRRYVTGGWKARAGGLVVRTVDTNGKQEVLLVSSRKHPHLWIIPAGTVERGETEVNAALREVAEEAGATCTLVEPEPLGQYADADRQVKTAIYVMRVAELHSTWEDMDAGRRRAWWGLHDAVQQMKKRDRGPLEEYIRRRPVR
mmetsp:Transcript_24851/g.74542  ORF Transcript_24851/g.74542 Transcript_24851/m.74542 type:complete len:183 (+) Transcript_24851:310-858(+)